MMVTPEPAPSERSRPIAMAFMIWEGTFGNGVKTGPMPAGTAGSFGALPGSTNILMICYCRIAATICPPVGGTITDFGACWDNGSRFTVHRSLLTVRSSETQQYFVGAAWKRSLGNGTYGTHGTNGQRGHPNREP
jgi:hypothetical protein